MLLSSTVWWSALALSGSSFANRAWWDGLSAKIPQVHMTFCCAQGLPTDPVFQGGKPLFWMKSFQMNNLSVMSALIHRGHRVQKTHNSLQASLGKWLVLQSKEIKKRIHWIMRSYHFRICTHKHLQIAKPALTHLVSSWAQLRAIRKQAKYVKKLDDFGYGFQPVPLRSQPQTSLFDSGVINPFEKTCERNKNVQVLLADS